MRLLLSFMLLGFLVTIISQATAAEAVGVTIEHNGKPVAGYVITHTGESDEELLALMREQSVAVEPDYLAENVANDDGEIILKGNVSLIVERRNTPTGTQVNLDRLILTRDPADSSRWIIPSEEVDRALDTGDMVLQYEPATPMSSEIATSISPGHNRLLFLAILGGGFLLLLVLIAIAIMRMASSNRSAS